METFSAASHGEVLQLVIQIAVLLAAYCVSAGYLGHYGHGGDDPMLSLMHTQAFMKDLGLAGAFLILAVFGPGSLSVDGRRQVVEA